MSIKSSFTIVLLVTGLFVTGCGNTGNNTSSTQNAAKTVQNTTRATTNETRSPDSTRVNKSGTKPVTKSAVKSTKVPKSPINAAQWMTVDTKHKTITLKLVAGYQGKNGGMNFNGFAHGDMSIVIPLNWHVNVRFTNEDSKRHSVMIVPYVERKSMSLKPAFRGAFTPEATRGIGKGQSQSFSFKPTKQGQYAIVSAVPGQTESGMWDSLFAISNSAPAIGAK